MWEVWGDAGAVSVRLDIARTWSLNSSFSFVVIVSDLAMIGTMLTRGERRRRNSTSIAFSRCGAMK